MAGAAALDSAHSITLLNILPEPARSVVTAHQK